MSGEEAKEERKVIEAPSQGQEEPQADPEKLVDLFIPRAGGAKEGAKLGRSSTNQPIGQTRKTSQLEEHNQFYYQEYARLYFANIILTKKVGLAVRGQLQSTINERNILKTKLNKLEVGRGGERRLRRGGTKSRLASRSIYPRKRRRCETI